jgi:hypothetical protein
MKYNSSGVISRKGKSRSEIDLLKLGVLKTSRRKTMRSQTNTSSSSLLQTGLTLLYETEDAENLQGHANDGVLRRPFKTVL